MNEMSLLRFKRALRVGYAVIAFSGAAFLHVNDGSLVFAQQQQQAYQSDPIAALNHHLEYNDTRLDGHESRIGHIEGACIIVLPLLGLLNLLGFIKIPARKTQETETHVSG